MGLPAVLGLALLQGITEFIPVSSSGHLVLAQHLLRWNQQNAALDAVLHLGTAVSILAVFWKDLIRLAKGLVSRVPDEKTESRRYLGFLIIGTVPAAAAGILLKDFFERMFLDARMAGLMFFVTAAFLFASGLKKKNTERLNAPKSAIIGLAQALAILPGISRSGSTISTALLLGTDRKEAGRFSFFLGLPVICGAALLEFRHLHETGIAPELLLLGFVVSAIVGYAALKLLLTFVDRGRIHIFGYYLVALGLLCLIFL